jgi:hypothetical protein
MREPLLALVQYRLPGDSLVRPGVLAGGVVREPPPVLNDSLLSALDARRECVPRSPSRTQPTRIATLKTDRTWDGFRS